MNPRFRTLGATVLVLMGCADAPPPVGPGEAIGTADNPSNVVSSVRWNRQAIGLFRARGGSAGRVNAYLAMAQYRSVLAAEAVYASSQRDGSVTDLGRVVVTTLPSLAGAAAGASAVVLKLFYPLDTTAIDAELARQRTGLSSVNRELESFVTGEAIGREVGAEVLALAATDRFGATSPGLPPVGAGYWTSSGASIVRGGFGARPFFLRSGSELRAPPPPDVGSPAFLAALGAVREISASRTLEQIAIAQRWVPSSGVVFSGIAGDLIVRYRLSETEAARILAHANLAAFDAIIGCFDTKFAYWYIRPTQADSRITLAVGLPNHPSYPSAHSCETGAWQGILTDAFPAEREMIEGVAQEANLSRVYGGIHYRFDGDAGLELGRSAARLALQRLRFGRRGVE